MQMGKVFSSPSNVNSKWPIFVKLLFSTSTQHSSCSSRIAASIIASFGSTLPPKPFHLFTPKPRFLSPNKICVSLRRNTSVNNFRIYMIASSSDAKLQENSIVLIHKINNQNQKSTNLDLNHRHITLI